MDKTKTITTTVMVTKTIRKILIIGLLSALAAAMITSCSPKLSVISDYDHSTDFASYKTFSMYNLKTKGNVNQLNQDRIIRYIKAEMVKKGFTESNAHPDLMINAITVLKNRTGISATTTNIYGYGGIYRPYYWGGRGYTSVSTYDYKDGSLVIDILDAKTQKMIWTGSGSSEIYKQPKNPDEVISEAVAKILAEFPIGSIK